MIEMDCYNRPPLRELDGIPIFSQQDDYVQNYVKISSDHVAAITKESDNPWIEAEVWEEMESGTLQHVLDAIKGSSETVRILDVGVGLGRLLDRIKASGFHNLDLYGIDISLPYLQIAHSKGLNVAMAKIEDMPYASEYFDVITCTDVLEHVEDLNLCITKILNCLKPGGKLIVRVPNREDLSSYLKPDYPYHLAHIRSFDEFSLELMFTRIFKLEFAEKSAGLLIQSPSLLKYKLPIIGYNLMIRVFLRAFKLASSKVYRKALQLLYYPTEINVVLRKSVR
jgi:SAM-dependent methyltransferase